MGRFNPFTSTPAAQEDTNPLPSALPIHELTLTKGSTSELGSVSPPMSSNMDELAAFASWGRSGVTLCLYLPLSIRPNLIGVS